ncbi:hypothetical protein Tco_1477227 [Tanacetum coccineum]
MEGTEMTKQERESMLYDEFDKFTSEPGESIHSYYLRFAKLINDMNMISMTMTPMQINTKFVNHLQPEWSMFATAAKQARNLHKHYQSSTPITQQLIQSPPLQSYAPTVVQQPPTFQHDTGLAIPTFLSTDDPIANEEKQDFLPDSLEETDDCEDLQLQATTNFKADHVDAYDSDCDDEATANAIFMANLSPVGSLNDDTVAPRYDSDTLSEVPHNDTYHDSDMLNSNIQELGYTENIVSNNESYDKLKGNNDVISYTDYMLTIGNDEDNYVPPPVQKNDMMLSVIPKVVEKNDLSKSVTSHLTTNKLIEKCIKFLALRLLKIESEPINAYFKNNRAVHRNYLKVTKENVATLHELLEEARALKPLDEHIVEMKNRLITTTIEEYKPRVDASRMKQTIETITQKHAVNQNTRKTDNTMLPSIGRVSSTNASGSKPESDTKNDRIPQPSNRSKKNKVEAHHRKFKSSANMNC